MSRKARILRLVSGVLFIGAGLMTYLAFENTQVLNMIAVVLGVVGVSNILAAFLLSRFFPDAREGD